ncbi:MAG: efflux RND transporter periplasmic adaptor subunit [Scytolyngbya sp. HA4215-MV1]|jgi:HlyD family secretion protein|nr:efflux RND transporter periplasmic adaptor subunit [Scytolyngbya sp. HA4215-MV1]
MKISLGGRVVHLSQIGITVALIGLVGVGGFVMFRQLTPKKSRRAEQAITVVAKKQNLQVRIQASGTITPIQAVNVSPKNAGRLVALLVDQGDRVQAGQVIARMEDRDLQTQLAQAEATLFQMQARLLKARNGNRPEEIAQAAGQVDAAQAQAQLTAQRTTRNRSLYEQGAISRDQFDAYVADERKAKADLRVAQKGFETMRNGSRVEDIADAEAAVAQAAAQVQSIQVQLEDTVIRAPLSGVVTQKYANVGAFVTPTTSASSTSSATSTSIVAIASKLEVVAKVPETSIRQVRVGQKVEIAADAYPDKKFRGRVRLVAPEAVVEQNVTSFQVRGVLETGQSDLKSGMNVSLVFLGNRLEDAVVVPAVAIVSEKGKTGVLVKGTDDKPKFQPVTVGISMGDQIQIVDGLNVGDSVFVYLPRSAQPQQSQGGRGGGPPAIRFR